MIVAIAAKDLRAEARSRGALGALLVVQVLIVLSLSFAISLKEDPQEREALLLALTPGVLWVSLMIAAVVAVQRSFGREVDEGTIDLLGLAPVDEGEIFAGKVLANLVLLVLAAVESLVLMVVFLEFRPAVSLSYVLVPLVIGAVAMAALGTVVSAVAAQTSGRQVVTFVLLVPAALYSVVLPGIEATEAIIGAAPAGPVQALGSLTAATAVYLALGLLLFGYVLHE